MSRSPASAVALVLGGALSLQFGSALAALLFPRAGAFGVVTLRLTIAAALLLAVCRPRLRGRTRHDWLLAAAFGLTLGGMNILFYQAIERIPLGVTVTLEVLGPLVLSVAASRRALSVAWAALALAGVVLLGRGGFSALDPVGVAFALGAGVLWACYVVLGARVGGRFAGADGLAFALGIGAVLSIPVGAATTGTALLDPVTLGLGAAVAVLSSMLPYTLELMALRRLPAATFSVLMSLGPAVAAFAGYVVLGQNLTAVQVCGVVLVVVASVGAVRMRRVRRHDEHVGSAGRGGLDGDPLPRDAAGPAGRGVR
ncbi:EamA family transporter [Prauserella cavernicola]|uniref:EamA family transporter n=1 Tax=Prauserella cavernicola TaxID=2800127 RepID=UPI0027DCBD32|nr:EamA family transporter [Prauserella cavernicola]